jgi:hypothetical protein
MAVLTTTVRQLLKVDSLRQGRGTSFFRLIPPAAAILNALMFASFEHSIKSDPSGHALALFLLIEAGVLVLLNVSYFSSRTSIILAKARIFPVSSSERFRTAFVIEIRRNIVIALAISNAACFALFFGRSPSTAAIAVGLFLLLAFAVESLTITLSLLISRTLHPPAFALALGGVLVAALAAGLMAFNIGELIAGIPLVNWCTRGILAGLHQEYARAAMNAGILALTGGVSGLIGTRTS